MCVPATGERAQMSFDAKLVEIRVRYITQSFLHSRLKTYITQILLMVDFLPRDWGWLRETVTVSSGYIGWSEFADVTAHEFWFRGSRKIREGPLETAAGRERGDRGGRAAVLFRAAPLSFVNGTAARPTGTRTGEPTREEQKRAVTGHLPPVRISAPGTGPIENSYRGHLPPRAGVGVRSGGRYDTMQYKMMRLCS